MTISMSDGCSSNPGHCPVLLAQGGKVQGAALLRTKVWQLSLSICQFVRQSGLLHTLSLIKGRRAPTEPSVHGEVGREAEGPGLLTSIAV